jgi:hypothetical protein
MPTCAEPGGDAIKETSPLGTIAPEVCVTLIVKLTVAPWVMLTEPAAGAVIVVVSPWKGVGTLLQFDTRFETFTEPSPVARS